MLSAQVENELKKAEEIVCIFGEPDIENYHSLYSELRRIDKDMQTFILQSRQVRLPRELVACRSAQVALLRLQGIAALVPGRVVTINSKVHSNAIGVIIRPSAFSTASLTASVAASATGTEGPQKSFQVLILKGRRTLLARSLTAPPLLTVLCS